MVIHNYYIYINTYDFLHSKHEFLAISSSGHRHADIRHHVAHRISTKQIEFLDIMVYKDQQHKIETTIFCKPADQQNSTPYSQALRIKTICSTTSEFNKNCAIFTKRFKERGYLQKLINEQVDEVKNTKRKQLLSTNYRTMQNRIPMSITYNRSLPNISNIFTKNWSILQYHLLFKKNVTTSQ